MLQMRSLLVVLAVFALLSAVLATDKLRGVKQSAHNLYAGEYIECDGGRKLPVSRVNDDFCDCKDGSDEPGTSACANGKFWCINKGFRGNHIPSSWVDDGKCDCCDGSDESKVECKNTCAEQAKTHFASVAQEIELHEKGLAQRAAFVEAAQKDIMRQRTLLADAESRIGALEAKVASLEKIKIAAEDAYSTVYSETEARLRTAEEAAIAEKVAGTDPVDLPEEPEKVDEDLLKEKIEHDDSLKAPREDDTATGYDEDGEASFWEQLKVTWTDTKTLLSDMWDGTKRMVTPLTDKDKAMNEWNEAKTEKDALTRDIESMKKFVSTNFGADNAFHALYGNNYEWSDREYTYKINAFVDVSQNKPGHHSTLGRWKGWDENKPNVMIYDGGDRCWGAPDRSTRVTVVCGDVHKVIDVKEPNKCEYAMILQTPAACSQAALDALKIGE